jgi:ribosome-binding protein aMBF1 (putative translation factor)
MLKIKSERKRRGWRLEDLAYHAHLTVADVSRIESGRLKPYPNHAKRLAEALELTPEQLLEEVKE